MASFSSLQVFLNDRSILEKMVDKRFLYKYCMLKEKLDELDYYPQCPWPLKEVGRFAKFFHSDIQDISNFEEFVDYYTPSDYGRKLKWFQICSLLAEQLEDWHGVSQAGDYRRLVSVKRIVEQTKQEAEDEIRIAVRQLELERQETPSFLVDDEGTLV
jgi:hypothetical protein